MYTKTCTHKHPHTHNKRQDDDYKIHMHTCTTHSTHTYSEGHVCRLDVDYNYVRSAKQENVLMYISDLYSTQWLH